MRSRMLVAVAVAVSLAAVSAQEPKKSDKDNKTVTVTGCVEGGYLNVRAVDPVGSYTERYRLAGSKSLLKEIASQVPTADTTAKLEVTSFSETEETCKGKL